MRYCSENTSCVEPVAVDAAFGFGQPDRDHLRGIVPLIDRRRNVEALRSIAGGSAGGPTRRGQNLGDFGLADAGLAFEEQRAAHLAAREKYRRQRAVADVIAPSSAASAWRRSSRD